MADVELTPDEVRHVATLARLGLDDAEVERLGRELTGILAHVNTIAALPIADVPPTKHSHENADSLRPDVSRPGVSRDEALRNAPDPSTDGFRVPPIGA
jgi:aspartyl-tRNA(Asn)/glutamyl-tRNA(Gln) amidotransferase subunit C